MSEFENLGSFFRENKKLVKDYLDARLEIYKLKLIRIFSKSAGYFIWIIISLFLLFLFFIFLGLVTGFWLSELTGSYVTGFTTTLIVLVVNSAGFTESIICQPDHPQYINWPVMKTLPGKKTLNFKWLL
jgi:hypothetical protein